MKLRFYFFVLLLCSRAFSQPSPYHNLLYKTYAQRLVLVGQLYAQWTGKDAGIIFQKIDSIARLAKDSHDDDLLVETAVLRTRFFVDDKHPNELKLQKLDSLRQYAVKMKKKWAEIIAENIIATYYFDVFKQYEKAFEHHLRAVELLQDISSADFPDKQSIIAQLAAAFYVFRDYSQSRHYNLMALEAEPLVETGNRFGRIDITNTIGLCYQHLGNLDSAEWYLKQAYQLAVQRNRLDWQGISTGNLGNNYFLRGQYNIAIPMLEKDVAIAIRSGDWALASGSSMVLADISLRQNDIARAARVLSDARQYAYLSGQYKRLETLYPLLSKLYVKQGNAGLASVYLDSALFVKDSMARQFNGMLLLRASQKLELEKYRAGIADIENRQQVTSLQRNIAIGILLVLATAGLLIYKNQKKKYREQKQATIKAQEELADATRLLNDFTKNLSEKNKLIDILEQQQGNEASTTLQQLRESTILTDGDWEYFRKLFEKVHTGFLERLKEKMPGLTPAEIRFMALSRLNFSVKEMASMLGISTDAVRKLRARARKKHNIEDESVFIETIAAL